MSSVGSLSHKQGFTVSDDPDSELLMDAVASDGISELSEEEISSALLSQLLKASSWLKTRSRSRSGGQHTILAEGSLLDTHERRAASSISVRTFKVVSKFSTSLAIAVVMRLFIGGQG